MSGSKIATALSGSNVSYIQELYENFLADHNSVDSSWRELFIEMGDQLEQIAINNRGASWSPKQNRIIGTPDPDKAPAKIVANNAAANNNGFLESFSKESIIAVLLVNAYKSYGHFLANLDPLGLEKQIEFSELYPANYGIAEEDLNKEIYLGGIAGFERASFNQLVSRLRTIYCQNIGYEFMHVTCPKKRDWLTARIENVNGNFVQNAEDKKTILFDLTKSEMFEQFLHTKFPGAKRFSVEGGESFIASLEQIITHAAKAGVKEVVLGMAHRGRLNVLTKVMGRSYALMLAEFMGKQALFSEELEAVGDVKYHQGASLDRIIDGNKIHLSLAANPSHLEAVNPVVEGKVRAKQDRLKDTDRKQALPILVHGDAAFCGQGVIAETFSYSCLEGYRTGGTVHIVINNQVGFTTSRQYSRISMYPTEIAKSADAPIFHVNGDDAEAVAFVSKLALEYRQEFGLDVVVDIFCYRRYGHNEGDEPFFTQPVMYKAITGHLSPMQIYAQKLIVQNVITTEEFDKFKNDFKASLEEAHKQAGDYKPKDADWLKGSWEGLQTGKFGVDEKVKTGVELKKLQELGLALSKIPEGLEVNKKLIPVMKQRQEMAQNGKDLNWAMGEALAYASVLAEGHNIRLSGQDSIRGTFSHRHSALINQVTEERYFPLNNLGQKSQGRYEVLDSNLSEYAVLGFEYGYSLVEPNTLTMWEAQFGDFANTAQVIIDQFIASSEAKWLRLSGLVMLLPHGYEGQGPEHSSARLERFLQLCAADNMIVANCTTPANLFHILRRQLKRNYRKPLILMTPKSLLRHKKCVSDLSEFQSGTEFLHVIEDKEKLTADDKVRKLIICSGKVYYDLLEERTNRKINDVAIIRLEQLYPFPADILAEQIAKYKNAAIVWCQEEPKNMGAWYFVDRRLEEVLLQIKHKNTRPSYAGRCESASPAAGYYKIHNQGFADLINDALN